jgi:hypothetical protein
MAKRRRKRTADGATEDLPTRNGTTEGVSPTDERTVEQLEQREEAAVTDEESPEERDPEELDRELGISRGPETPVQSSAELLDERDRRRK